MTATSSSPAALAVIEPAFTEAERLAWASCVRARSLSRLRPGGLGEPRSAAGIGHVRTPAACRP